MKLSEILEYRTLEKRKIYCIETDEDLYFVKGTRITKANNNLYDAYYAYIDKKVSWSYLERRINSYSEIEENWIYIDKSYLEKEFKIENVYANDEKIL